jgi:predicted phosphodiesterase
MKDKYGKKFQSGGTDWMITRREFLRDSGLVIAGFSFGIPLSQADRINCKAKLSFGIVTDAHYADAEPNGTRCYRESLVKMNECVKLMNDKKVDFLIELGDFKDQCESATENATLKYLTSIEKEFRQFRGPRYHVLGNHDVDSISKKQFMAQVKNTGIAKGSTYYSFNAKGFHFVVLDANFTSNGSDYDHGNFNWEDTNIPVWQIDWLREDLASTSKPVIAFVHQQLDVTGSTGVRNAPKVREVFQESGKVLAVFQGHHHAGLYSQIEGIHYYTLKAMVEGSGEKNNSYAIVDVCIENSLVVSGYRNAISKNLEKV